MSNELPNEFPLSSPKLPEEFTKWEDFRRNFRANSWRDVHRNDKTNPKWSTEEVSKFIPAVVSGEIVKSKYNFLNISQRNRKAFLKKILKEFPKKKQVEIAEIFWNIQRNCMRNSQRNCRENFRKNYWRNV